MNISCLVQCKIIQYKQSRKLFLALESAVQLLESRIQLQESRIQITGILIRNPATGIFKTWNVEFSHQNPESTTRNAAESKNFLEYPTCSLTWATVRLLLLSRYTIGYYSTTLNFDRGRCYCISLQNQFQLNFRALLN